MESARVRQSIEAFVFSSIPESSETGSKQPDAAARPAARDESTHLRRPFMRIRFRRAPALTLLLGAGVAVAILLAGTAQASDLRRTPIVIAVQNARPSIVNIHGEKTLTEAGKGVAERRVNGMGTGVVIDPRGYIITNHHVVDGVAKIRVTLSDTSTYIAKLISHDPVTDLAVIKIDSTKSLPVINVGRSDDLMPGESVIAVGNAYGYENTVTQGIISELHRPVQVSDAQQYDDLIQTDASINPGNSGGPLLNIDGEMIGLNVAVRAGAQGIGFAIPIDKVMCVAADLMSCRRLNSAWHGIEAQSKTMAAGFVVDRVEDDSPAAAIGLKSGDVVTLVDGQQVVRPLDLERALLERRAGDSIPLVIQRDRESLNLKLVLAAVAEEEKSDSAWDVLGLKLKVVPQKQFQLLRSKYNGGLEITEVRPGSPAAVEQLKAGDILVGMHVYETVKLQDVSYILSKREELDQNSMKFYIIRGDKTFMGSLPTSGRKVR